jgi:hypothetical protein
MPRHVKVPCCFRMGQGTSAPASAQTSPCQRPTAANRGQRLVATHLKGRFPNAADGAENRRNPADAKRAQSLVLGGVCSARGQ